MSFFWPSHLIDPGDFIRKATTKLSNQRYAGAVHTVALCKCRELSRSPWVYMPCSLRGNGVQCIFCDVTRRALRSAERRINELSEPCMNGPKKEISLAATGLR
jgi:hypothetical protein